MSLVQSRLNRPIAGALIACLVLVSLAAQAAAVTSYQEIYSFNRFLGYSDGVYPTGPLVPGTNGVLYGTTEYGGLYQMGTFFQLTPPASSGSVWTKTILFNFGANRDAYPIAGLVQGANGILYGEFGTFGGGVYSLTPPAIAGDPWVETILPPFPAGGNDPSGLVTDVKGSLFGATGFGGDYTGSDYGHGTIFLMQPPASPSGTVYSKAIYSFPEFDGELPELPWGPLLVRPEGIYGTTLYGGSSCYTCGTIFKLTPSAISGKWNRAWLYSFTGGTDGYSAASLVSDKNGVLYGLAGGVGPSTCLYASPCGGVFSLTPPSTPGGSWTEATIFAFDGSDGSEPSALLMGDHGRLFGITELGGGGPGVVFALTPPLTQGQPWTETILHYFTWGSSGASPAASMIGVNGAIYGVVSGTGDNCGVGGCGTIFKLVP